MTAQGPWNMSRSSINIRQVNIIVCPFSSALIYAISEMWKRQIIWGCGRHWPPFSFKQQASDVSLWQIQHSALPLWIFCQGCYYFHFHPITKMSFYLKFRSRRACCGHKQASCGTRTLHWLYSVGYLISIIQQFWWDLQLMQIRELLSVSLSGSADPTVCPLTHRHKFTHKHLLRHVRTHMQGQTRARTGALGNTVKNTHSN